MTKILGLDLGTNSIGWAIRDTTKKYNQIIDKGVLTFEKGVCEEKNIEFPLVKKRTEARGRRRNYQAEKYRKWELLKLLIVKNKFCPLDKIELDLWKKYEKDKKTGEQIGRKYPTNEKFIQWLRYDFDGDGKPDFLKIDNTEYANCYLYRALAVSEKLEHKKIFQDNPEILGRIFYHLVQRRGFKGVDEEETRLIEEGRVNKQTKQVEVVGVKQLQPLIEKYGTLGAALYYGQKNKELDNNNRIRSRFTKRNYFESEIDKICEIQNLGVDFAKKLKKAITWQRPLRSQKGLIGYCTIQSPVRDEKGTYLKKGKKRCAISHPIYEEYRTWCYINNFKIKYPLADNIDEKTKEEERIKFLSEKVYPLFERASDFKFKDIKEKIEKLGAKVFAKYDNDTSISSNEFMYRINEIYGDNWRKKLNWNETLTDEKKTGKYYRIEDVWHLIFHFINEKKEDKDTFYPFIQKKLALDDKQLNQISKIMLPQGYASLSINTIRKIIPYLQKGLIYSEAIFLANAKKLFSKNIKENELKELLSDFRILRKEHESDKLIFGIVNSLISKHLNEDEKYIFGRYKEYQLKNSDYDEIEKQITDIIGEEKWSKKTDEDKLKLKDVIAKHYLEYLQKLPSENPKGSYKKMYRFDELLQKHLIDKYNLEEKHVQENLWHPSDIDKYAPAPISRKNTEIKILGSPMPISRGFKNPMAMKTLYQLKNLINYQIETQQIDNETRIVIELARELNDTNRRKAIEEWQREREKEKIELAKSIIGTAKIKYPDLDENDPDIANKARLWYEQLPNGEDIMRHAKALKTDIEKLQLWKEQECRCMYTGKIINITELFDGNKFQIEHTIPAKMSWCSELWNLTICDADYNNKVKQKRIPYSLDNYSKTGQYDVDNSCIEERIKVWEDKVQSLKGRIEINIKKTKGKTLDKAAKDRIIIDRRKLQKDLEYWEKKLATFTQKEFTAKWRRQQITDTQIATKYAYHYLKTVFDRVDVEYGITTSQFRKIFQIETKKEKKERTKHSHHAVDAAVLTLIPPSNIKKIMLDCYNEAVDKKVERDYHPNPVDWYDYNSNYIRNIENEVLINFLKKDTTLLPAIKIERKNGKVIKHNGKVRIATGSTIRGQLHKESFYGAIYKNKIENGSPLRNPDSTYQLEEKPTYVIRKPLVFSKDENTPGFKSLEDLGKVIIDKPLFEMIKKQVGNFPFKEALEKGVWMLDKNGKPVNRIRKVRVEVPSVKNPLSIKQQTFKSEKPLKHLKDRKHKETYWADNDSNIYYAIYQNGNKRAGDCKSLFEVAKIKQEKELIGEKINNLKDIFEPTKNNLPIHWVIKPGDKIIYYKNNLDEIRELIIDKEYETLRKRTYRLNRLYSREDGRLQFQLHIEARDDKQLKKDFPDNGIDMHGNKFGKRGTNGFSEFDFENPHPRLLLSPIKFNFAIEGKDFEIKPDGEIVWIGNEN